MVGKEVKDHLFKPELHYQMASINPENTNESSSSSDSDSDSSPFKSNMSKPAINIIG